MKDYNSQNGGFLSPTNVLATQLSDLAKQLEEQRRLTNLYKLSCEEGQEIICELKEEIERLNNIVNELEKYLEDNKDHPYDAYGVYRELLERLQELKESEK